MTDLSDGYLTDDGQGYRGTNGRYVGGTDGAGDLTIPKLNVNGNHAPASGEMSPSSDSKKAAGKSGRVIEKLMAENDRLKRELKSETTKREEEQKRGEAARSARDAIQSMHDNLIHQTKLDKTSIERRDTKIKELKEDRDEDRNRRAEAESNLKKYSEETDKEMQSMKETLASESSDRERTVRQYEVLQNSWKHLEDGYKSSISRLRKTIEEIRSERTHERMSLQKLEVIVEQQRQELEKMRAAWIKAGQTYEERMSVAEKALKDIRGTASKDFGDSADIMTEARENADKLRHLLKVRQNLRPDP